MFQRNWILWTLLGAALIYEASAIKCIVCNSADANCVDGTKPVEANECEVGVTHCYVRITDNKVDRGCLPVAQAATCSTDSVSTCRSCTGTDGCNSQKWLQCHKCGVADTTCSDAKQGTGQFCTNFKTADRCYERFEADKVTRGCESDLVPATNDPCSGNKECKVCNENDCNKDASSVFQLAICIQCSTNADPDGTCLKGTKTPEKCGDLSVGKCYSRIIADGVLERGCQSTLSANDIQACTTSSCNLCNTEDGCNKGIFPADRPVCYRCTASATQTCANDLTGDTMSEICKTYKADDKCYSRVTTASVFERGCQSDLPANEVVCDGLANCLECTGKNCNALSEQKLRNRAKCQQCDSTDPACVTGTSSAKDCADVGDSCFVRVNNGKLERNCLATLTAVDQTKCTNANDQSCETCTGQNCNTQTWVKCHQCKETANAACNAAQLDANAAFCPKYNKDNNQCYERLENEKVVRGCASDLSEAACKDNLECRTCTTDACNKEAAQTLKTNQRCLQCSSTSDAGGLCVAGTSSSQPCKTESDLKCYRKVDADGQLKRGCRGELTDQEVADCKTDTCDVCQGSECNKEVFPANRLKCYQCKTSADDSCKNELQGADKSGYCKLYVTGDKCYSRDANDVFERGCQSDLGKSVDACKDLDAKHCLSCTGNDCNAISKTKLNSAGAVALNVVLVAVATLVAIVSAL